MSANELTVLTVWQPNEFYTKDWLLKIQNSISRNLTIPHKHVCLTNEKLDHCETIPFDERGQSPQAYWLKVQMYRSIPQLSGPCLYFDLDMVIINSLDIMVNNLLNNTDNKTEIWGAKSPFVSKRAITPKHFFNSSILFWKKNPTHLWEKFITSTPKGWHIHVKDEHTHGDQAFVATFAKIGFIDNYCPEDFIKGIKKYIEGKTSIIFFAGKRKPNSYVHNPIIEKNWRI
jgi:hypothetical protein